MGLKAFDAGRRAITTPPATGRKNSFWLVPYNYWLYALLPCQSARRSTRSIE